MEGYTNDLKRKICNGGGRDRNKNINFSFLSFFFILINIIFDLFVTDQPSGKNKEKKVKRKKGVIRPGYAKNESFDESHDESRDESHDEGILAATKQNEPTPEIQNSVLGSNIKQNHSTESEVEDPIRQTLPTNSILSPTVMREPLATNSLVEADSTVLASKEDPKDESRWINKKKKGEH